VTKEKKYAGRGKRKGVLGKWLSGAMRIKFMLVIGA